MLKKTFNFVAIFLSIHLVLQGRISSANELQLVLSIKEFDDILKDVKEPIFAMLSLSYCLPCKQHTPLIEKLAKKYEKVHFIKISVDKVEDGKKILGQRYDTNRYPTLLLLRDGKILKKYVGRQSEEIYCAQIEKVVADFKSENK